MSWTYVPWPRHDHAERYFIGLQSGEHVRHLLADEGPYTHDEAEQRCQWLNRRRKDASPPEGRT
jgi:hypothetical protein